MEGVIGRILPRKTFTELLILSLTSVVFSICAMSFSSYIFSISKSNFDDTKLPFLSGKPIPSKYIIEDSIMSPVFNQGPRGTCWMFQIITLLETQYKQQGLERGFLKKDEYVKFSPEAIGIETVKKCMENPNASICHGSTRALNTTDGGSLSEYAEFIRKWPELKKMVVPSSCCPYQQLPADEMKCPDLEKCLKDNPLEFELVQTFITTNIHDIKQRLYETQLPQAFSLTTPQQRYIFPCTNSIVKDSPSCIAKDLPCPHNISEFCSVLDFKMHKPSDVEFLSHSTEKTVPGTAHAIVIVGYNDNFVPKRSANFTKEEPPVGGFILKNSWGPRGHTYEYLMGQITEDQDAVFCPNKDDVFRWVPATIECMKSNKDPAKCSLDARVQRGKLLVSNADELVCVNASHCKENETYVLLRENENSMAPSFVWSKTGVPTPRVIHYGNGTEPTVETFETLPLQHLYYALQLKKERQQAPSSEKCGYMFITYRSSEDILRLNSGVGRGLFETEGMRVNWLDKSYKASGKKYNYDYIDKSTITFKPISSKDPLQTDL